MPVQHVSAMDIMNSHPALDEYNRIPSVSETLRIITKAASYTCLPEESGAIYTATAAATFTLPAVTQTGWHAYFVNKADTDMAIISTPVDIINADNDAAADSLTFSTSGHKIGGWCHLASDGTNWLILGAGLLSAVATIGT
jgi:hypothetical protein